MKKEWVVAGFEPMTSSMWQMGQLLESSEIAKKFYVCHVAFRISFFDIRLVTVFVVAVVVVFAVVVAATPVAAATGFIVTTNAFIAAAADIVVVVVVIIVVVVQSN